MIGSSWMTGVLSPLHAVWIGFGITLALLLTSPADFPRKLAAPDAPIESIGDWELESRQPLTERELTLLGATDHWRHRYRHRVHGGLATVTWISGAAGAVASHHPEVCYQRESFVCDRHSKIWKPIESTDEFRIQRFRSRSLQSPAITVAYGWKADDRWVAPAYPRWSFADADSIHRLQISIHHPAARQAQAQEEIGQLLTRFASLRSESAIGGGGES